MRALRIFNALRQFAAENGREAAGLEELGLPEQATMDPHKLRFVNEVQHRVTRFIEQILIDDPARSSDEVMLRLLLAPRAEKAIEGLVHSAYTRTIQAIS